MGVRHTPFYHKIIEKEDKIVTVTVNSKLRKMYFQDWGDLLLLKYFNY